MGLNAMSVKGRERLRPYGGDLDGFREGEAPKHLASDIEWDTIGFVDRGDNSNAVIEIAKRRDPEEPVAKKIETQKLDELAPEAPEAPAGVDVQALLSELLKDEAITPEQHAALVAAMAPAAPAAEPMPEDMAKRADIPEDVKAEMAKQADRLVELEKRAAKAADAEALQVEIAKVKDLPYLPESAESVAGVLRDLEKAYQAAPKEFQKDLGEDELSPMDKLRGLMAAFANAVETAELFRERGTSRPATDTDMEKIDPNDDTIPAGDRVDALITQEIAKAEKAGEKIDFSKARKQVLAANPKLAAAYL